MSLTGQLVWITGASSGIGEALAHELAGRGARLVLSARREAELLRVRQGLPRADEHVVVPLDLADPATLQAAARRVEAEVGPVDVLVHNGGISQRSLAVDTSLDVDRKILEVDYLGVVALTKAVLPSMLGKGGGRFVVVSSLVGYVATPYRSSYSAAKHALHGFFEALRAELYDRGIRVTMICPGFVKTQVSINALTGDGSPLGTMDDAQAGGMSADECARRIARAIEQGKDEVLIGGKERFAVYLRRFLPAVYRRMVRRVSVR